MSRTAKLSCTNYLFQIITSQSPFFLTTSRSQICLVIMRLRGVAILKVYTEVLTTAKPVLVYPGDDFDRKAMESPL